MNGDVVCSCCNFEISNVKGQTYRRVTKITKGSKKKHHQVVCNICFEQPTLKALYHYRKRIPQKYLGDSKNKKHIPQTMNKLLKSKEVFEGNE